MTLYKTKEVMIEAVQFTGDNVAELIAFTGNDNNFWPVEEEDRTDDPEIIAEVYDKLHSTWVGVKKWQYIIKGMKGEFYPCDPEIFDSKYEAMYDFTN